MNNNFAMRFGRAVIHYRWAVLIATIVIAVIAGMGMKKLSMSGDYKVFFKPDNQQLVAFEALQKTYTKSDNVMFVLAPKNGDVFTRENLDAVIWLTNKAWKLSYSSRVDSVTNYQNSTADGDTLNVRDLVANPAAMSNADIKQARNIAVHDPLLEGRIISPSAHVTGVNVTFQLPDKDKVKAIKITVAKARELKAEFEKRYPNTKVYLNGIVMMNSAFLEATRDDMRTLVPIMMAVVVVMLLITLRSVAGTALIMLSIILSIAVTMGLGGWYGVVMSAPLATAPLAIMIMAIADGVHVLSHYGHSVRHGMAREEAMAESIGSNLWPMFLTNILSAIGYASMVFSEVPPFQTLGVIVAVGIVTGFLVSVTLIPAVMMMLPGKVGQVHSREDEKISLMERYTEFFLKHRNKMLVGSLAVTLVLGSFITRNEFNDSFHKYFAESTEFRQATDFTLKNLTGVYLIDYSLSAGQPSYVNDPAFLKKVDEFAQWYRLQPEVLHVNTFTDIMKRLNKNMHADDPAYSKLPDERELAAQYLLLYEMSLPYGLDLNDQINLDKSATRFTVTLKAVSSNEMIAVEARANAWLKAHGLNIIQTTGGSGAGMMFAHIGKENGKSMMMGNIWQIILISVLIIFAVRSFKLGAISLIPNLMPAVMAYGVWGLAVGEINMAVSMVAGISLGIVVDDTVHFLSKYLNGRRDLNMTPEQSIRHAFDLAGVPMWISTFILVAGFLVLATSPFSMNADMGILTAITIAFAALTEAFMLPALLLLVDRGEKI